MNEDELCYMVLYLFILIYIFKINKNLILVANMQPHNYN